MDTSRMPPRRALAQMLVGNQIQQGVYVAAKLGISDLLKDGPKHSGELARAAGVDADALYRLLRALAAFGVYAEGDPGCFELTPLSQLLRAGADDSMRAFALWSGRVSYQAFAGLEYSVRTGEPWFEQAYGTEFFEYLSRHPETGELFDDMMSWNTTPVAPAVAACDFSGVGVVVDVGGGRGELLASILRAHPSLRGLLADHPRVARSARRVLDAAGVGDRCTILCGDILESVPDGGDVYVLKSVLHGLDDEGAVRLLTNCRRAMNNGARLLLVEFVMPPGNDPFPGKLMDLLMLVGCHGRERTEGEFRSLSAAAGFRLKSITTTKYAYSIIEAAA